MNKTPFITEAEAMKEDFKGRTNYWMCRPEITNAKDLQICRAVLPAGEGHDFHHHPELEEAIYVIEGEVEQWVGKEKQILKVGEVAHMPPGVVHATFNLSGKDAVTRGRIWRIRPVGAETPASVNLTDISDDGVIGMLGGPSARTAAMAWAWLGERKTRDTLAKLARIAVEPKSVMARRLDAFWALELGRAVTPAILKSLIADPSSAVRYQAVRAAGKLQASPAEFASPLGKAPDDPSYRVRAALANAVRAHREPSPEMMSLVARLGREPLDAGGRWEKYDREFERYLARWAMETHSAETAKMPESDRSLSQENRLLVILALEPGKAAFSLVKELPSLSRPLRKDELTLLSSQIGHPRDLDAGRPRCRARRSISRAQVAASTRPPSCDARAWRERSNSGSRLTGAS